MSVKRLVTTVIALTLLLFIAYYVVIEFRGLMYLMTPPSQREPTAEIHVNSSGAFLELPINFDERKWVDAIIITEKLWILDDPAIKKIDEPKMVKITPTPEYASREISKLINMFSSNIIWMKKELDSGTYIFNVTSVLNLQKGIMYPIWRGKVVIGDEEYPLTAFGNVVSIPAKLLYNSSTLTISIGVRNYADHPVAVGGSLISRQLEDKALEIFRKEGVQGVLEYMRTVVLPTIVECIKNGTIRLAWSVYPPDYIPLNVVHKWMSENKLTIGIELRVEEITANATVTRPDTGFTYYVVTYKYASIKLWTHRQEPEVTYEEKEALYTQHYIPGYRTYAVILIYRDTPYSYYKALGYIARVDVWHPLPKK